MKYFIIGITAIAYFICFSLAYGHSFNYQMSIREDNTVNRSFASERAFFNGLFGPLYLLSVIGTDFYKDK